MSVFAVRRLRLALIVASCASCVPEFALMPGTQIDCETNEHCPEGYICKTLLQRCVLAEATDSVPPGVESVLIKPTLAGAGTEVVLSFTATEDLLADPEVTLELGSAIRPLFDPRSAHGRAFVFAYSSRGDEPEATLSVLVTMADIDGNQAVDLSLGKVTFDFTAPSVMDLVVSKERVREGDRVTLDFRVNETLGPAPRVSLDDGTALEAEDNPEELTYSYGYTATGDEAEVLVSVAVNIVDAAGNATGASFPDAFAFDFEPPEVSGTPSSWRDVVREGQLAAVTFSVSEALRGDPIVVLVPQTGGEPTPMSFGDKTGNSYTFIYEIASTDPDGTYTISLETFEDLAGNPGEPEGLGLLRIDNLPPVWIQEPEVDAERVSRVLGFDEVTVSFSLDEPAHWYAVQVGDIAVPCTETVAGPQTDYACRYVAQPSDTPGAKAVTVQALDAAGNGAFETAPSVVFDFAVPDLALASVAYTPDADNPLGTVTAATAGTIITVIAIADEPLSTAVVPSMTAILGSDTLTFATDDNDDAGATFWVEVPAGFGAGDYVPAITWTDLAGNQTSSPNEYATFATPPIVVNTSIPTLKVSQAEVVYLRSPWGNAAPEELGAHTIPAGPYFAVAPLDPLANVAALAPSAFSAGVPLAQVRVWADGGMGSLMGTMRPNDDGTWPRKRLANLDTQSIHVTGVDEAGNESTPIEIENVEWVATPNPPGFGESPHRLDSTSRVEPTLRQNPFVSSEAGSGAEAADTTAILARAGAAWRERLQSDAAPLSGKAHAMAYDSARGVVVLFGGDDGSHRQETWEWDGIAWTDATPAAGPSARSDHAMAYDSARGVVVLFGGYDGSQRRDTWEWDGSSWTEKAPAGAKPSARSYHAMAYDSARGVVVLFGGGLSSDRKRDTWEWDGTSWTEKTPAGTNPSARSYHAMAYDSARGVVVLFGGNDGFRKQDTWEWDGTSWTEKIPVGAKPSARDKPAMAYDSARGVVVLFGGGTDSGKIQDTWEWDGATLTWTDATPPTNPSARQYHAMAYDSARGVAVLFGGDADAGLEQDTWEWDGGAWTERTPAAAKPSVRSYHAMVYDSARGVVVLFGGNTIDPVVTCYQDTWEWDGTSWTEMIPTGAAPSGRYNHAMVYDSARGVVVLFGGHDCSSGTQDIWEWNGATSTWTDVTPVGLKPSARYRHAMAYDSVRGKVVLFAGWDGGYLQDTWEWDDGAWIEMIPVSAKPSVRYSHAMAYDSARGKVVLFGGSDGAAGRQDTWEWDGATSTWAEVTPAGVMPIGRSSHAMVYDSARHRVVLFGGEAPRRQDIWEWDGGAWAEMTPEGVKPSARYLHAMAYDSARDLIVLFGGYDGSRRQDTWEWDASAGRQSALTLGVGMTGAGIGADSMSDLRVRAHCGGEFAPFGAADIGATLYGWSSGLGGGLPGEWLPLAANTTGINPAQPYLPSPNAALLDWRAGDAVEARRYVIGPELHFQCRPAGSSGVGAEEAAVALDYIEVRVRYEATRCGNGIQTTDEECEDGNLTDADGCDSNCTLTACGNGVQTTGEQCDDGGESMACDADCTLAVCNDDTLNAAAGEECEDGNLIDGDGCDSNCTLTACGNGVQTTGEQCDDGNLIDGDGCSATCRDTGPPAIASHTLPATVPSATALVSFDVTFDEPVFGVAVAAGSVEADNGATLALDAGSDGDTVFGFTLSNLADGTIYTVSFGAAISDSASNPLVPDALVVAQLAAGHLSVFISEVAWMGDSDDALNEWAEICNGGIASEDLSSWGLYDDGVLIYTFASTTLDPNACLAIEDAAGVSRDCGVTVVQEISLANSGDCLELKDGAGTLVSSAACPAGAAWPAGDNTTKQTMYRISPAGSWRNAAAGDTNQGGCALPQ